MDVEDLAAIFDPDEEDAVEVEIDGVTVPGFLIDIGAEVGFGPGIEGRQVTFYCDRSLITHAANGSALVYGDDSYTVVNMGRYGFSGVAELELRDA